MSKRLIALPVAIIAAAVLAPGIANAASFNTTSSITIAPAGTAFTGKVGSPHAACKPNRTVTLQRKVAGGTSFTNVGTDKTDSQGNWSVSTTPQSGAQYRAKVAQRTVGGDTCKAVTTQTLTARATATTIGINSLGNAFTGKVTGNSDCIAGRTVTLQRKNPGATSFANIGTPATTTSNGSWSVATSPVNNAEYRAKVSAKKSGASACMAKTSSSTKAHAANVTISQGANNFHGSVQTVTSCKSNRTVTLQRKGIYESLFSNIGSDATNSNGAWQVNTVVQSGASYRAKVSAKQVGSDSCMADTSNVIVAS